MGGWGLKVWWFYLKQIKMQSTYGHKTKFLGCVLTAVCTSNLGAGYQWSNIRYTMNIILLQSWYQVIDCVFAKEKW